MANSPHRQTSESQRPSSAPGGASQGSASAGRSRQLRREIRREDLAARQMQALKALLKELAPSYSSLPDLVSALLLNVTAPEGHSLFSKEALTHVYEMVLQGSVTDPISISGIEQESQLASFLQDLGHFADAGGTDKHRQLVNQAIEVLVLLSLRWFSVKELSSVPVLSDFQRRSWLPAAFTYLVGQIIWRHRTAASLSGHAVVVENLRWITLVPGLDENLMDRCNVVFRILTGSESDAGRLKLGQWRKVIGLIAMNPDLRTRVRRSDAVRACYGDALSSDENGLNQKQFKLMLMKTADLMGVHPIVLFQALAAQAETLEAGQKPKEESKEEVADVVLCECSIRK